MLQRLLAQFDLVLQHTEVVLQQRVRMVLAHLLEQHTHGRQWRAQLMGGAGSLGRHGQQLLVAQTFFTAQRAHALPISWRRNSSAIFAAKNVITAAARAKLSHMP